MEKESLLSSSGSYRDHLISQKIASTLSDEYEKQNYETINKSRQTDHPDAKEVVFDFEVLEGYLQYVKTKASEMGLRNPKIKIVFGQYPKDQVVDPRQSKKYMGYQTVYMIPEFGSVESNTEITSKSVDVDGLNFGGLRPPY